MSGAFHDHFSTVAGRYAAFRPHYPGALFDYLATLASRATLVWDCAAGSGQASGDLADRFDRVIATDASEEQITSAQPHPRIEYRVALAEESGLPDHSVGLVTVAQALHWLDLERFWPEVKRVLAPRGLLAVWGYGTLSVEGEAVNLLVQDFYEKTVGPYWPTGTRARGGRLPRRFISVLGDHAAVLSHGGAADPRTAARLYRHVVGDSPLHKGERQ